MTAFRTSKLDADESVWFGRQLEHVKSKTYDKKFTKLKIRELLPTSFEAGEGAETITYEQFDEVGAARVIVDYANDFKSSDVRAKEFTGKIKSLGSSYKYSIQEIRANMMQNKSLVQRKANSAKRRVMELENKIAFYGDTLHSLNGWLTNANIPDVALAADGSGASTTLLSKTPAQQIRDLNNIANAVVNQSNGVETADTMLLPIPIFTSLVAAPRSDQSDKTVLNYFMENNIFIEDMDWVNELAAANSGGVLSGDTAIAYRRDPDVIELEIPKDFEQFPPEPKGMAFEVACHERHGGVSIYYPLAMAKSDDV